MTSETVTEEQETADDVVEEVMPEQTEESDQETEETAEQPEKKEEFVPVSAQIAERKKRQEAEERARWLEQQLMQKEQAQQQQIPDNSDDLLTVGQQNKTLQEFKRQVLEEAYMEQNPDIVERIKTELPDILNDPRHKWLADSIPQAPNRLQRAAQILDMFSPKKEKVKVPPPNRDKTPKSPQSVAKTNKGSMADRIMSMSDQELEEWRLSQKRKR